MTTRGDDSKKLIVNMISESEFTVQGHGVHTAFKELTRALSLRDDVDIEVNTNRTADIVHIQTIGPYSFMKLLSRNGKKVVSAHVVPDSFIGSLKGAKYWRPIGRWWLKTFYGKADLVLACSGMVRDELRDDMGLTNVDLLYNTVNMDQYKITADDRKQARKRLNLRSDDFVVVGNGQVQPRKRLDTFISIAKSMPDARFFWVGGIPFKQLGAEASKMQHLMDNLPDNVTVTGVITLEEVKKYYQAADVFILPATQENHPMCVLEAAGASLPIVLRDIPQYNDTFRGHALMASTDEEFIEIVKKLRSDKDFYAKAQSGAKEIAKKFDSRTGAERVVEFYRSLI